MATAATLEATGELSLSGVANLESAANISTTATKTLQFASQLDSVASIAAEGFTGQLGNATLNVSTELSAVNFKIVGFDTEFSSITSVLLGTPLIVKPFAANLENTATLESVITKTVFGDVAIDGVFNATATADKTVGFASDLDSAFAISTTLTNNIQGASALNSIASLTAIGRILQLNEVVYIIPTENRTFAVTTENRGYTVPFETRTYAIEDEV